MTGIVKSLRDAMEQIGPPEFEFQGVKVPIFDRLEASQDLVQGIQEILEPAKRQAEAIYFGLLDLKVVDQDILPPGCAVFMKGNRVVAVYWRGRLTVVPEDIFMEQDAVNVLLGESLGF